MMLSSSSKLHLLLLLWMQFAEHYLALRPLLVPAIRSRRQIHLSWSPKTALRLADSSADTDEDAPDRSRPPIIPFDFTDFARKDIPAPRKAEQPRAPRAAPEKDPAPAPVAVRTRERDDDARPTGYANDARDDDDDTEELRALTAGEEEVIANPTLRFLKDVYIGSPYDNKRRKEARIVVRSVTAFSVAIGVIFTLLWYFAPGKFISYKGDMTGLGASPQQLQRGFERGSLLDPATLLDDPSEDEAARRDGDSEFLDDRAGVPDTDNKRVPLPSAGSRLPSFRSQNI